MIMFSISNKDTLASFIVSIKFWYYFSVNKKEKTLKYSINGIDMGVAVDNIPAIPLFPAFSLYNKVYYVNLFYSCFL